MESQVRYAARLLPYSGMVVAIKVSFKPGSADADHICAGFYDGGQSAGFLYEPGDLVLGQAEYKVSHGLPWCLGVCCIGKRIGFFQFIK